MRSSTVLVYHVEFPTFWGGNRIRDRCWVTILTRHLSTSILMYTVRDLPFMSYCSCKYIPNYCRYNVYNLKGIIDAMIICLFLYIRHKITNGIKLILFCFTFILNPEVRENTRKVNAASSPGSNVVGSINIWEGPSKRLRKLTWM